MFLVATYICLAVTIVHVHSNSEKQLNGTIAVVTGGAKGIGRAIVDHYLRNGAKTVVIVDKNQPRGMKTENELNNIYGANRAVFIHGDVTTDLDKVSKIIFKMFWYVDILVNNAGIQNEYEPEKMIKTNALAPVLWSRRFFECMRKDRGGRGGTIINVASISSYTREPFFYYYKSSKFAVLGLTVGMGHEVNYLISGVRIFAICPGSTLTDLLLHPKHSMVEHKDVYKKVLKMSPCQHPDAVGRAAALLYKNARTGMAYTVEGGAPPVVSPDSVNITVEYLLSV